MLMRDRMIVDDRIVVFAALPDEIPQEHHVNVIVQIGNGNLNSRRFAHVVYVNLEPTSESKK